MGDELPVDGLFEELEPHRQREGSRPVVGELRDGTRTVIATMPWRPSRNVWEFFLTPARLVEWLRDELMEVEDERR